MDISKINVLFLNPAPSLIKYGMFPGAVQAGANAYLFDGKDAIFQFTQEAQLIEIEKKIIEMKANVIFTEGYTNIPLVGIRELCDKYNVQLHMWTIEDPVTPHIGVNFAKKYADYIWTTTIEFIQKYEDIANDKSNKLKGVDLLLFGCNPDIKPCCAERRFVHDISIVGRNYDNRFDKVKEFVVPLLEDEFDTMIYGKWWLADFQKWNLKKIGKEKYHIANHDKQIAQDFGHDLPFEWLPSVVNSSKIMFGLNCSDYSITQTSCRPYETLNCSNHSVYLAWYTKAQENIFGEYMYQAKTGQEMVDMAREILKMTPKQRQEKATLAREFVQANHTYKLRFEQVATKAIELGIN